MFKLKRVLSLSEVRPKEPKPFEIYTRNGMNFLIFKNEELESFRIEIGFPGGDNFGHMDFKPDHYPGFSSMSECHAAIDAFANTMPFYSFG